MSGAQTSSFYPVNQLLQDNAQQIQNQYAPQRNELFVQRAQQEIGGTEIEMLARGSQSLLALGDEAKMAEQYPSTVAELQRYGFAKNAPSVFPGRAALERIAAMGTSSEKQYAMGQSQRALDAIYPTGQAPGPGASTAPTGAAPAVAPGSGATFAGGIAGFEGGGNAMPPENPRWPVARGGPAGAHQFIASTWNEFAKANPDLFKGMSPEQILAARSNPELSTQAANWYAGENAKALTARNIEPTPANLGISHALGAGGAAKVLTAPDNTPLSQVIPETIAQNPQYGRMTVGDLKRQYSRLGPVGGPGAPGAGGGVAARTGGVDVAGPGVPPGAVAPVAAPGTAGTTAASPAAPVAAPAATPAAPTLNLDADQLRPQDREDLARFKAALVGNPNGATLLQGEIDRRRTANVAAEEKLYQHGRNAQADMLQRRAAELAEIQTQLAQRNASTAEQRAAAEATEKARVAERQARLDAAGGNSARAVVLEIGPKIIAGTATDAERQTYELNYQDLTKGQLVPVPDPSGEPGKTIFVTAPGSIPSYLPPPDYRPPSKSGSSLPAQGANSEGGGDTAAPDPNASTWTPGQKPAPLVKPPAPLTEGQGKAGRFSDRMFAAEDIMAPLHSQAQNWAERAKQNVGDYIGYSINSPAYESMRQAQDSWIMAKLRDESGATIGTAEFERDRRTFFPQPGEGSAVVEQKRKAREIEMAARAREAGSQYKLPPRAVPSSAGGWTVKRID
jgi:hypothetical protein